jgi:hypothetical protein
MTKIHLFEPNDIVLIIKMSGPVVQLVNAPVSEIGNLLKWPLGYQTSVVLLGFVVLWYGIDLLAYVSSSACNASETCTKIFYTVDNFFFTILVLIAIVTYAYYFYDGIRAHGLISFKSYAKPIGLGLFFWALGLVLTNLTSFLSTDAQTTGTFKEVTQRYFGRLIVPFDVSVNVSGTSGTSLFIDNGLPSAAYVATYGFLLGAIVALVTRR